METILFFLIVAAVFAVLLYREKLKREKRAAPPTPQPLSSRAAQPTPPKLQSRLLVEETVSVVLRRQIPVRFDEPPRSWLGGLPMMPAHVRWPTAATTDYPDRGRTPLHFVAQVACADLPQELWGGLGPRSGWLLLFLNGEDWDVMENPEALQVLHIPELGPERQPPPGALPVHNEIYTGPDYGFVRSQADVPAVWRRWPVDLVPFPNRPMTRDGAVTITPEKFASILYENAPVVEERGAIRVPEGPPFSWRGALYVVDSVARSLSGTRWPELRDADRDKLNSPASIEQMTAAIDERVAADKQALHQWDVREIDAGDAKALGQREWAKTSLSERIANLALARDFLNRGGDVWLRIKESLDGFQQWRASRVKVVAQMRERILAHDLDMPLPPGEWEALRTALDNDRCTYWVRGYRDLREGAPMRVETSLLTLGSKGLDAAKVQIAADYYAASAEKRSLVPPSIVAALEPYWRRLYSNRPHRMGGIHDPIQSEPRLGPVSEVLLFQIASDDAMHWVWGDAGAYYVFIDTDRLAKNDFTTVQAFFENH